MNWPALLLPDTRRQMQSRQVEQRLLDKAFETEQAALRARLRFVQLRAEQHARFSHTRNHDDLPGPADHGDDA